MHVITNIFPPSPTSVFKAGKCISPLYIFCFFFFCAWRHSYGSLFKNKRIKIWGINCVTQNSSNRNESLFSSLGTLLSRRQFQILNNTGDERTNILCE